ncbi:MAG TPA: carbohydrate-binding domain-containing protein, partial [Verrucomicrobiae bacterium]
RTIHTFNDRMFSSDLNLRWRAGTGAWQSLAFTLPAAGQRQDSITFTVPAAVGAFDLQYELSNSNNVVYTNTVACSAMASTSLTLPVGVTAGLYDPKGTTAGLLNRFGIAFAAVTDLRTNSLSQFNLLIVGRDALTNDTIAEAGNSTVASRWKDFARGGGWVLVLEQTNYPSWMPAELALQNYDASFAFPSQDHPVMQGVAAADLRWWAGDHRVVLKSIQLPSRYNVRALASVGSHQGLNLAAAAEVPLGSGGILCSQWLLTQRFDQEPLAGLLLQRLLNYCAPGCPHPALKPIALVGETNAAAAAKLTELSVLAENVSGRLAGLTPALYPVLMIAGGSNAWQEAGAHIADLAAYVSAGGKLVLHRPSAAFLSAAQPALFPELNYTDAQLGAVLRRDVTNPAVRLASDDLYWIDQAGDWNHTETLSTNVASRYYRKKFNLATYSTIQVENMPIHTSGGASSGGWFLWVNGYVAQNINVTQAGTYLFNVFASGTPALGGWPIMTLKIDGLAQDSITVPTNQVAAYTLMADLTPGTHQLAISYDNDAYAPPEDRNLFLDQIQWGREADNSPTSLLTRPGAVAQVRHGAGVVILDEIGWETETKNAAKAGRYACRLLTGLGGACQLPNSLTIEAEAMTNVNVSAYNVSGGITWLYSNGRIESQVRITTAGNYTFEVFAGGTTAQGVYPQVAITVNGANRATWFLTSTNMTRYAFTIYLGVGTYKLGLAFLNDANPAPEDRNAAFDRLTLTPETAFRIVNWSADSFSQTFSVQWECLPFKPYEVQICTNLAGGPWQAATNFTVSGNIGSWTDTGFAGAPPLNPDAPERFYRVRQSGP